MIMTRLIAEAGTPKGRLVVALISALLLWPGFGAVGLLVAACIAAASFSPGRRAEDMSILAAGVFLSQIVPQAMASGIGAKPVIFSALWVGAVALWSRHPVLKKRSPLVLHVAAFLFIALLAYLQVTQLRFIASALAFQQLTVEFLWRTSYWIKWRRRSGDNAPILKHLYALIPFVGAGGVPIGKNPDYFARHEARDEAALTASQIEGLKLLLLATLWRAVQFLMQDIFWAGPNESFPAWLLDLQSAIPPMPALLQNAAMFSIWQRWTGLFAELFRAIIELAVFGHTIVGVCCLMGYRLPRNTQAPLLSTSIVEFWNRYYYYFKELLLDYFFFPVYLKLKGLPVYLRTILSTFAAAFLGNIYYHVLLYGALPITGHPDQFLQEIYARVIYCSILATGLSASMLRSLNKRPRIRVLGMASAILFFALIHIWNAGGDEVTVSERWKLFTSLAGM